MKAQTNKARQQREKAQKEQQAKSREKPARAELKKIIKRTENKGRKLTLVVTLKARNSRLNKKKQARATKASAGGSKPSKEKEENGEEKTQRLGKPTATEKKKASKAIKKNRPKGNPFMKLWERILEAEKILGQKNKFHRKKAGEKYRRWSTSLNVTILGMFHMKAKYQVALRIRREKQAAWRR